MNKGETPFQSIIEHEEAVQKLATKKDRMGAAASLLLALANDEEPDMDDLETLGLRGER